MEWTKRCSSYAGGSFSCPLAILGSLSMFAAASVFLVAGTPAVAIPAFARKYNLTCVHCHTMPPRLTRFGYAFYRAGFRLPEDFQLPDNKAIPYTLSNSVSAFSESRLQNINPGGPSGFDFGGVELGLATSIDKSLALRAQYVFSSTSETGSGFDEAWVQFNSAASGRYWSARVGQIPILSGYQLLGSRNITLTDPQLVGANGPLTGEGQGNFAIGGMERGVELGYARAGFYGRFSWLNGINEAGDGGVALGGHRANDFLLQADYLIGHEGSALGAFYYHGRTPLESVGFNNNFERAGLFGTWGRHLQFGEADFPNWHLELNGGLTWGQDTVDAGGAKAISHGGLVEAALYVRHRTALVARYDNVRPSSVTGTPTTEAYTLAMLHRPNDYMRFGMEYRNQHHPGGDCVIASLWFFH